MTSDDELEALQIELELRRRHGATGVVEEAPLSFRIGSSIKQAIPEALRPAASSVANVLRQPLELGGMAVDISRLPVALGHGQGPFPISSGMRDAGDVAFGKPNVMENLLAAIGLGGATGVATKAIGPLRGAIAGGLGYLGGEAGGSVGKNLGTAVASKLDLDPKAAQTGGEAIGVGLGTFLTGLPTILPGINTANRLAAESLKGVSQANRRQMAKLQAEAAGEGLFTMPSQLDEARPANLRALERDVLQANVGKGSLETKLENILPQSRQFAARTVQGLGKAPTSLQRANQIQDVVEAVVNIPRERAREAAKPFYEILRLERPQLPVEMRFDIAERLGKLNEQTGLLERSFAGRAASKVAGTVVEKSQILSKEAKPFELSRGDIYSLDNYMKELSTRIQSLSGISADSRQAVERAGLRPAMNEIRSALIDSSSILKAAKQSYERVRGQAAEQVRTTGIPAAKPIDLQPGPLTKAAEWRQFDTIVNQGNADDVRRASAMMRTKDQDAFRDVVKNWLQRQFESTILPGSGNASEPKVFAEKLLKHPNLDAMLEEAAKGVKEVDPTEFVVGFKKAMRILQASGRPVVSSGSSDIGGIISNDPVATAGRFGIVHELGRKAMLASKYFEWAQNRQWKKLYEVLDSPDSMKKLADMADKAEMSPRTAAYLSAIVGGTVSID